MSNREVPLWAKQSDLLHTLVAVIGGHSSDPMFDVDAQTSACMKVTMENFRNTVDIQLPYRDVIVSAQNANTWHLAVTKRVIDAFRTSHFSFITADDDYAANLGNTMDSYTERVSGKRPQASLKRWRQDGHRLVTTAIREGIAPIGALFGVVPGVVKLKYPDESLRHQYERSTKLLASAQITAMDFARQSNDTHTVLIRDICTPTSFKLAQLAFDRIVFKPDAFTIIETSGHPDQITTTVRANTTIDHERPFGGCPAIKGGGVAYLAKIFRTFVTDHDAYAASFELSPSQK